MPDEPPFVIVIGGPPPGYGITWEHRWVKKHANGRIEGGPIMPPVGHLILTVNARCRCGWSDAPFADAWARNQIRLREAE